MTIVMLKLIHTKFLFKNPPDIATTKKFNLLIKNSGVIPLVFIPGIGVWYSGLCGGRVLPLFSDSLGWRQLEGFFFYFFLLSLVLWAICYK
jgi:hypothetical protein